jgi:hypothetical protein
LTEEIKVLTSSDKNEDDLAAMHAILEKIFEDKDLKIPIEVIDRLIREVKKYL